MTWLKVLRFWIPSNVVFTGYSNANDSNINDSNKAQIMTIQTRIIHIEGMTCGGCVASVHNATADIEGLDNLSIELANNQATVTFDDTKTSAEEIATAIDEAGFDAIVAPL